MITDEGLAACAARRKARLDEVKKAFTNPETLDEFEMFLRQKTEGVYWTANYPGVERRRT